MDERVLIPMSNESTLPCEHSDLNFQTFCRQATIALHSNEYLERQQRCESNARSYPRAIPIAIAQAKGIYVQDTAGQLFIDCLAGAGTLALGHNHQTIHKVLTDHLQSGAPLHTLDITTPVKDRFIEKLFSIVPGALSQKAKVHFCGPTGADAVEAAVKLAKTATGRSTVLAFSGAYHGMTQATLGMMGNLSTKAPVKSLMPDVQFLPYPNLYRCPFGLSGEQSIAANLNYIETLLSDPLSGVLPPAAIIVEAIQGEGGVVTAPVQWLQGLRALTRQYDIPLIFDEVQCGMGRSGKMFAFEHADIVPDVIVISKAIGGGLPLSMIVYDEKLDVWQPGAHTGTFRGNQLAMAAGSATIDILLQQHLPAHAEQMGQRLRKHLDTLQKRFPHLGDIRGRGLMLGVEVVDIDQKPDSNDRFPASGKLAAAIARYCLEAGLILETGGRDGSTLRFLPPLIINGDEIDKTADIFAAATERALSNAVNATTSSASITA